MSRFDKDGLSKPTVPKGLALIAVGALLMSAAVGVAVGLLLTIIIKGAGQ